MSRGHANGARQQATSGPLLSQRGASRVQIPCWGTLCSGFRVKKVHLYRFRLRISKRFIQFWGSVWALSPTFCGPPNMEISTKETYPDPLPKAARKPPGANKTRIAGQRRGLTRQWSSLRRTEEPPATRRHPPTVAYLPHTFRFFFLSKPNHHHPRRRRRRAAQQQPI